MSNTRKTNPDLAALLSAAKLPERTVDLCLRGDLQAEWEMLHRDLEEARLAAKTGASLAGEQTAEITAIEESLRAVEDTMAGSILTLRFRALNRNEFKSLGVAHPPRSEDKRDNLFGFNVETFNAALIRLCLVEPELDDEQWTQLLDVLTPGQYRECADTCEVLNHSQVDVPFSSNGSPRAPSSAPS